MTRAASPFTLARSGSYPDRLLEHARRHASSQGIWVQGQPTPYGQQVGYPSLPWDGAFVDVMLAKVGLVGAPSFINSHMAFSVMQQRRGEITPGRIGSIALTAFGTVGIVEAYQKGSDGVVLIQGDVPVKDQPHRRRVDRLLLTRQDILIMGLPRGIEGSSPDTPITGSQIRSDPERYLRGALQAHPYTQNLGPVSISSALHRWALICGARPEEAQARRFKDAYLERLGHESGYFANGLR